LVRDTCNCTNGHGEPDPWFASPALTITEPDKYLTFNVREHKNVSCNSLSDGGLVIDGVGGWGTYKYGLKPDSLTYDGIFGKLKAGLYTIYIKDGLDETYSDTVRLTEPGALNASIHQPINNVSCNGLLDGGFSLDITGGTQPYYLSLDNNQHKTKGTSISGLSANTYHVLVSDTNRCNTSLDINITQPDPLNIFLDAIANTLCRKSTGQISVTCSGGTHDYVYQWIDEKNNVVNTMSTASDLMAGVYHLNLTDAHQCKIISPKYTITNTDGPIITDTIITPVSCFGFADGRAKIIVNNGLKPYAYLWSNGQTTDSATNLSSDSCMVMVTDNNKCPNSAVIYIPHPDSLTIASTMVDNPQCHNYTNGSITITGNGGTPSYEYAWSNSNAGSNNTGLRAGDYIATITDAHNCKASKTFSLTNPNPVIIDLGEKTTVCTGQTVLLDAGDFKAYSWTSDNGFTNSKRSVTLSDQGIYYLQVMDKNNCLGKDTFTLNTSSSLLDALFLITPEATVGDTVVAVDISWPEPDSIYWVYDNNLVHGRSRKDYEDLVFTKPGTYLVTMQAKLGNCRDSYSHEISIKSNSNEMSLELGAKDPLIQSFIIRPNPNNGNFAAEVTLREQSDITLKLYNFSTLTNQKELKGQDNYIIEYSIPNITPGVFILELAAGNEHKMLKMIVY
jgi:SprB repeat